jgi:8-oxo-dGTP pyrophosphatase MutT (NUDIX family)
MSIEPITAETPLSQLPNFDPRKVPVASIDRHLAAVRPESLTPQALRQRFTSPPKWEPEVWSERGFTDRQPARASVLIPIVMRDELTVILTERTAHLSTHSGQVAFPGGKRDETDTSAIHTALREAHEEIGLETKWVEVIGQMPTYTTVTRFLVTPVVALVRPEHTLVLNAYEVADAFEVPLTYLVDPANHQRHAFDTGGVVREWFSIVWPAGTQDRFIWGATAAMLRNFYRFLVA